MNLGSLEAKIVVLFMGVFMAICESDTAQASGCFGGQPDIVPTYGRQDVPRNTQIRITHKDVSSVQWIGPHNSPLSYHETYVGKGSSVARVLTAEHQLKPGQHKLHTHDPDILHEFTVGNKSDVVLPQLSGSLSLEAFHTYEPSSTCPETRWIKVSLNPPQDDLTPPNGFSYLVFLEEPKGDPWNSADLLVNSEVVTSDAVSFRIGEAGCGCIPRISLQIGMSYRVSVYVVDGAGHISSNFLSSTIRIDSKPKN